MWLFRFVPLCSTLLTVICVLASPAPAVTFAWANIGDPGNAADTEVMICCGSSTGTKQHQGHDQLTPCVSGLPSHDRVVASGFHDGCLLQSGTLQHISNHPHLRETGCQSVSLQVLFCFALVPGCTGEGFLLLFCLNAVRGTLEGIP